MNPEFLKYLQQITSSIRNGMIFNPLDELQKRATDFGQSLAKGEKVGPMPRAQDYPNADAYGQAIADYAQKYARGVATVGAQWAGGKGAAPEMEIFEHRSPKAGLTTLDAKYQGTGRAGAEAARGDRPPMLHVQTPGSKVESQFANDNLYHVAVPKGTIYDVATDPDKIIAKLRESGNLDLSAMEKAIKKAGYNGYHNSEYYPEYVKLYGKHKVIEAPKRAMADSVVSAAAHQLPVGDRLLNELKTNGGFTIDPETHEPISKGYAVGGGNKQGILLKKPLTELQPNELEQFLATNKNKLVPGQAWGGWVENGHTYIEPSDQVADLNEAQRLGNERGEKAIWDHANMAEIPLKLAKAEAADAAQAQEQSAISGAQDAFHNVMGKWQSILTDRGRDVLYALHNPAHPEAPWMTKYTQHDIERPNGVSPEKIDRVENMAYDTFKSPQFRKWLEAGRGTGNWYDTRMSQAKAIVALGDKLGPQAFNEFIDHVAASTAMSRPENNIRRASWWRALNLSGLLDPQELRTATLAAPEGMGHIAQRAHHYATADLVENGKLNLLANPKPGSFAENLKMNWRPVTFDTRMSNATMATNPKMSEGLAGAAGGDATPRKWAYAPIERAAQRVAAEAAQRGDLDELPAGVDPTAGWQAQVWGGIGRADKTHMMSVDNPSFNQILDNLLKRSAERWGVSHGTANELFWKGHPLDLPLDASLLKGPAKPRKK